jgi:glycine amidinotransferase
MSSVNSHNGWSHLEEVIVGSPCHLGYHSDVAFKLFFWNALTMPVNPGVDGPWSITPGSEFELGLAEEMEEDVADLVSLLEREGVKVRRPEMPATAAEISTPGWTSALEHSSMPRDMFLIVGNEIIETAPMVRSRYLESHLYKELFTEYFNDGAKWSVAPPSRLLPENFDYSYVLEHGYDAPVPGVQRFEIMFDGAQVLRVGRDLIINCSTANHRMGRTWLQRHLGDGYRVHEVNLTDNHIDAKVAVLRPGVLLKHRYVKMDQLPGFLRDWKVIDYSPPPGPADPGTSGGRPVLASRLLGMNVLSLDEERVVVENTEKKLIKDLAAAGFTPVPCRWRHGRLIGGGFHCMTLDVRRRSTLEDYS